MLYVVHSHSQKSLCLGGVVTSLRVTIETNKYWSFSVSITAATFRTWKVTPSSSLIILTSIRSHLAGGSVGCRLQTCSCWNLSFAFRTTGKSVIMSYPSSTTFTQSVNHSALSLHLHTMMTHPSSTRFTQSVDSSAPLLLYQLCRWSSILTSYIVHPSTCIPAHNSCHVTDIGMSRWFVIKSKIT